MSQGDYNPTKTNNNFEGSVMTIDKLNEAFALVKALAPKEAPVGTMLIKGATGLNIVKNENLPNDTIVVSKRLFDLIYESGNST